MMPFLKQNKVATLIRSSRGAKAQDVAPEMVTQSDGMPDGLMAAAEDLKAALEGSSVHGIASALRKAFQLCDASPHEESPQGDSQ